MEEKKQNEFYHDCSLVPVPNNLLVESETTIISLQNEIGYIAGVH